MTYIPGQDALVHQESAMIQLQKEAEPDSSDSEAEPAVDKEGETVVVYARCC